jgi:hypothetical protein
LLQTVAEIASVFTRCKNETKQRMEKERRRTENGNMRENEKGKSGHKN